MDSDVPPHADDEYGGEFCFGGREHCDHWFDCEPCCRCGFDGPGNHCDCPKHNPRLYDREGATLPEDLWPA